jgi:small GTP-binding protein
MASASSSCKLVLLGNGSVGKTSIIQRFKADGFAPIYKQTVGCDFFEKRVDIRNTSATMSVWDIGGQSINSANLNNYLAGSSAIFLCYDVTDHSSFGDLEDWLAVAQRYIAQLNGTTKKKKKQVELYIVGNKIDLIANRVITEEMHYEFIKENNLDGGFLVSAGSGENVLTIFYKVAAKLSGIELSAFELEFTRKVLAVHLTKGEGGEHGVSKMKGSEQIEADDEESHAAVMRMFGGGGKKKKRESKKCILS